MMRRRIWNYICKEFKLCYRSAPPGIIFLLVVMLIRMTGGMQFLELVFLDTMLYLRPVEQVDERVVIVDINATAQEYPVSNEKIAELLTTLKTYKPRVIGLALFKDVSVEPGSEKLAQVLQESNNIIGIEKIGIFKQGTIAPYKVLPQEQVGFVDLLNDVDYKQRCYLLSVPNPENLNEERYSLALQLVAHYFSAEGIKLRTGINDHDTVMINGKEFPPITNNFGGYFNFKQDDLGLSILINFRNRPQPFRIVSLQKIINVPIDNAKSFSDKVVLVGNFNMSTSDVVGTSALPTFKLAGDMHDVKYHAHVASQILSYVLDDRPMLDSWGNIKEYIWILLWGFVPIYLGRFSRVLWVNLLSVSVAVLFLFGYCYVMLWLWGIWIPIVPCLLILLLNGVGLTTFVFYQHDKFWQSQINERINTIKYTFDVIHNGPLQTLAYGLKHMRAQDIPYEQLIAHFEKLDREIRNIGEYLKLEALGTEDVLRLGSGLILDLNRPLHDLLYEVYTTTLERTDFEYFQTLKVKIRNFDPLDEKYLNHEQKRNICLFLEESLCNVGKHARGVKCVQASGTYFANQYKLWIKDNGSGIKSLQENKGTKFCKALAKQLGGEFQRRSVFPHGTICELSWKPMIK